MNNVGSLRQTQQTSELNVNSQKTSVHDILLVYPETVAGHFLRIAIVTEISLNRDSEMRGATVRMTKTNMNLKRPVNNFFTVKNTYHNTNQADKTSEQKLWREAAVIIELKMKNEC